PWTSVQDHSVRGYLHGVAVQPRRPDPQLLLRIFQALAVIEPEMLLVERGGHHALALEGTDDAAADDVGAGLGVAVLDGVDLVTGQVEQGHLGAVQPGDHAGVGDQVVAAAQGAPLGDRGEHVHQCTSSAGIRESSDARAGRRWPRSRTKRMSGSSRWSLTKVRKRLSFSGSFRALAHSHS